MILLGIWLFAAGIVGVLGSLVYFVITRWPEISEREIRARAWFIVVMLIGMILMVIGEFGR